MQQAAPREDENVGLRKDTSVGEVPVNLAASFQGI